MIKKDFFSPEEDNENKLFIFKREKNDMHATSLLNQGGYGCVYHPAISCDNKKNNEILDDDKTRYISKVQYNDKSSNNEIYISKIIKNINNYNNFFAPIVSSCNVDVNRIDKDLKDIYGETCGIYNKEKSKNKPFIMLSIPFIEDGNFNKNITASKKKTAFINLIDSYKHILNALILLNHYNIVHYDLKSDNILFNKIKNQPIIIDFGLSINFNQIKKLIGGKQKLTPEAEKLLSDKFYVFAPDYYLWCIEIHTICYLLDSSNNIIDDNSIKVICIEYVENNKAFKMFDSSFTQKYTESCINFLSQYKGKTRDQVIISLLDFHHTWDNFSISIMYLKLLFNILKFQTNSIILFFYEVLLININPNPNKRLSPNETLVKLFDLYSNENSSIDEIIKLFIGTDINVYEVKSLLSEDEKFVNSIIENSNYTRRNSTVL